MSGHQSSKPTRIWLLFIFTLLVGLLTPLASDTASADTSEITAAARELEALSELVAELTTKLEAATEEYNYAKQQYDDTKAAADEATANLKQSEADLAAARERLCERLVGIYKSGDIGTFEVLLTAESVTDVLSLMDDFRSLAREDSKLVDQIQDYKNEQAELQAQLDAELIQLTEHKDQTEAAQQNVQAQLERQNEALKGKEVQLAQLRKAEAERQARLAEQARQYQIWLASRPGQVVSLAKSYLGVPYVWGGSSPSGFDCSGLVMYVYSKVGVSLPHSSRLQYNYGTAVSKANLKAGDLVFFYSPIHHVGIYIGNGKMIDATGGKVQYSNVFTKNYVGARRVL